MDLRCTTRKDHPRFNSRGFWRRTVGLARHALCYQVTFMKPTSWYRSLILVGLWSFNAFCVTGCVGTIGDVDPTEDIDSNKFLLGSSEIAQKAINFGLSQLSNKIGSVYVGGCSGQQRFGGTAGGYFDGSCAGQKNYYQTPGSVGYDCSGLVYRMLKEAGIDLKGIASSTAMYDQFISIDKSQLLPGDLLVKRGSHVAMYIGNNQIIEATPYQDKGTVNHNGKTYRSNWNGVRTTSASTYINDSTYHARRVPGVQASSPSGDQSQSPATPSGEDPSAPVENPDVGGSVQPVPLYRMWNSNGDHFYTISLDEVNTALKYGYVLENDNGLAVGDCYPVATPGTMPLYRLWNPAISDHFYTTNSQERDVAKEVYGYSDEGTACWVFIEPGPSRCKLYRMYSETLTDHFYTLSAIEVWNAASTGVYKLEEVGGNAYMHASVCPD